MSSKQSLSGKEAKKKPKKTTSESKKPKKPHNKPENASNEGSNDIEDIEKKYYVCMVKQIQGSSKSEAKICVTEDPMKFLETINNMKTTDIVDDNSVYTVPVSLMSTKSKSKKKNQPKKHHSGSDSDDASDTNVDLDISDNNDIENNSGNKAQSPTRIQSTHTKKQTKTKYESQKSAVEDLSKQKTKGYNPEKNTSIFWNIELIIGRFSQSQAVKFATDWDEISRGINSRRERGLEVFELFHKEDKTLKCYDKAIIPVDPTFGSWLTMTNLQDYILPSMYMSRLEDIIRKSNFQTEDDHQEKNGLFFFFWFKKNVLTI